MSGDKVLGLLVFFFGFGMMPVAVKLTATLLSKLEGRQGDGVRGK